MEQEKKVNQYPAHPNYYNLYSVEAIEMARRVFYANDLPAFKTFCEATAFIYRMRMGLKPGNDIEQELRKERDWLAFAGRPVDRRIEKED